MLAQKFICAFAPYIIRGKDRIKAMSGELLTEHIDFVVMDLPCQEKDSRRMECGTMLIGVLPTEITSIKTIISITTSFCINKCNIKTHHIKSNTKGWTLIAHRSSIYLVNQSIINDRTTQFFK